MKRVHRTLCVGMIAAGLAAGQMPNLRPGFNLYSIQQDVELGRAAAQQIAQQVQIVRDPELSAYLDRIGHRLAAQPQANSESFPYSFTLVKDDSINAFALPGGPTFMHTGLIAAVDNEGQLAGVMAHEIAHVALRHGTNQASRAMGVRLLAGVAGAGAGSSLLGQLTQAGVAFGANSVLLKYSRDAERQADLLGAQIMAGAGYNPIEMARFFEKLEAQGGNRSAQFLSSHPNPGNRVRSIEEVLPYLPRTNYNAETGQFLQTQQRVKALDGGRR